MWFDQGELRWFDEPTEPAGHVLLEMTGNPKISVDLSQRRSCPKCPDSVLMRHFFSAKRAVTVDECPTCAGIWLDSGELQRIRAEYHSKAARSQAAREDFEEALVGDRMALMRKEIQTPYDTSRSRIVSSLLVVFYFVVAYKLSGAEAAMTRLYVCIVPWACVCFPEVLGAAISPILGTAKTSPRSFLWFFGWLVLLLPLIQVGIVFVETFGRFP
jgi:Zn-finger nucleic acid-binding protein